MSSGYWLFSSMTLREVLLAVSAIYTVIELRMTRLLSATQRLEDSGDIVAGSHTL